MIMFWNMVNSMVEQFPILKKLRYSPCDCTGVFASPTPVKETIVHLNDYHDWTREEIATWVDSL